MIIGLALTLLFIPIAVVPSPLRSSGSPKPLAPLYVHDGQPNDKLDNSYIVMFQDNVAPDVLSSHMSFVTLLNELNPPQIEDEEGSSGVGHVYNSVVAKGYSGKFTEGVLNMIRTRPEVNYVEQDSEIHVHNVRNDEEDREIRPFGTAIQQKPPWVRLQSSGN